MLKVVLMSSIFIILADLPVFAPWSTRLTNALFGTLKNHYECGRVVKALDSGSDVRGLKPPYRRFFFFLCLIFVLNTIFMIFSPF